MIRILFLYLLVSFGAVAGEWKEGTALPRTLPDAKGVVLNNQIYVMNGVASKSFFELYDVAADGWRPLTPLPSDLKHFSLAAGGGRIYLSGGRGENRNKNSEGDIWIYAPDAALWIRRAKLPSPRVGHISAVADGRLFLIGGISDNSSIDVYNIAANDWERINAPMPIAVADSTATLWGDEIIVAGGVDGGGSDVAAVQAFNIKTNRWRRLADLPQAASGVGVAVLDDTLHIIGGYAQSVQNVLPTHLRLVKNQWQKQTPLPQGVHQMSVSATHKNGNPQLVLIGGALGGGFYAVFTASDRVSIYDPASR